MSTSRPAPLPLHRIATPLLLLLGAACLYSATVLVDGSRRLDDAGTVARAIERVEWLASEREPDPAVATRELRMALTALDAAPAARLLEDDVRQAITALAGRLGSDNAAAERVRHELTPLLSAQQDRLRMLADAARVANARHSQWLLIATSLMLALSLATVIAGRSRLRRAAEERQRAESAAAASHRELHASVDKLTRLSRSMQRLSAYASLLQSCQATDEALDITKISLSVLMPGYAGSVYLLQPGQDDEDAIEHAALAISWGEHPVASRGGFTAQDCWGMRRARPFACDPRTADLHCAHLQHGPGGIDAATLCLPLSAQGEAIGLLYLSGPDPMVGDDLAVTAAEQLSMALANLRMKERLHHQSIRDALTGVFNRRYMEESLAREQSRSQRQQRPLALMMIDVDHFKRFNDSHGHPGGDALLAAVGKLLRQACRAEDVPCRYGGEEFSVIMPDTDLAAAQAQAERIRLAMAALTVRHAGAPLSRITASIGVAIYPQAADSMDGLVAVADAALYRAKSEGRNRVRLAEPLAADPA